MTEVGVEIPQTESKPSLGKRDYEFEGNKVEVNFVRFSGEGDPKKYDSKKVAFLLTGWPMRADAQITWGQPQMLAKEFGVTTYEIDGRPKGHFEGNSIDLEIEGIRQFASELEQNGIKEITLFGHSIGASKSVDLAVALEEKNPNLRVNVVLINPMGMFEKDIKEIARNYWIEQPEIESRTRNPNRISQPHRQVLVDIAASIFKDIMTAKWRYPKLFADQKRVLTRINSNLGKIKSPILVMIASEDPVSELEKHFPKEEMDRITPQPKAGEDSRDRMARIGKVRDRYMKENVFPQASDVKVIVATKYANHIAFGVERPRPTSHIIARYFNRLRR